MATLSILRTVLALVLLATCAQFEFIGWGHRCRQTTGTGWRDAGDMIVTKSCCDIGVIDWHYPSFMRNGLKIIWNGEPQSTVCILPSSLVYMLKDFAHDMDGNIVDLSPLQTTESSSQFGCWINFETGCKNKYNVDKIPVQIISLQPITGCEFFPMAVRTRLRFEKHIAADGTKVCVVLDNMGRQSLRFQSDMSSYMQIIQYSRE